MYCFLEFSNRRAIGLQYTNSSAFTFGPFKISANKSFKIHGNDQTKTFNACFSGITLQSNKNWNR
jgi:hypothetical protein